MHLIEAGVLAYASLSYMIFALAFAKGVSLIPVGGAVLVSFALYALAARQYPRAYRPQLERRDWVVLTAGLFIYAVSMFHVLLIPPYAIDDLSYHLLVPQQMARTGAFYFSPYNINTNMPMLFEYPFTVSFLTGIPLFTFNVATLAALLVVIYVAGRSYFRIGRVPLVCALVLVATTPTVYALLRTGYVELFLTLCLTLAFCHYLRFLEDRTQPFHWYAAVVFLGLAAAVKYTAGFFLLLVFGFEYVRKQDIRRYYTGAAVALVCFLPWYLKNALLLGNPTYPLLYAFFESYQLSVTRAHYYNSMFSGYHYGRSLGDYVLLPFRVLAGWQEPPVPGRLGFDGQLSLYTGLGVFGLGDKGQRKAFVALIGLGFFALWAFYSQQVRFLSAVIPLTLLAGLAFIESKRGAYRVLMYTVFAVSLVQNTHNLAAQIKKEQIAALVSGEITRDQFLESHLPNSYQFAKTTNQLLDPAKHKIFAVGNFGRAYYFDAPVVANTYYDAEVIDETYRVEKPDPMRLQTFLRAEGITHILINWHFYLSSQVPGAVDLEGVKAFFRDHADVVASTGEYQLFRLR